MRGFGVEPMCRVLQIAPSTWYHTPAGSPQVVRSPWVRRLSERRHRSMTRYGTLECTGVQSRPQEFEQDAKWSFCLTAGTLCPANQERQ